MGSECNSHHDFNDIDPGEPRERIPEGLYPALWVERKIGSSPWGEKLIFVWRVMNSIHFREPAVVDSCSKYLCSYYNIKRVGGRPKYGPGHAYRKDWICANNGVEPEISRSLPLSVFRDRYFFVEVVDVTRDQRGPIHPRTYWSKVQRVIRPIGEAETLTRVPLQLIEVRWEIPLSAG